MSLESLLGRVAAEQDALRERAGAQERLLERVRHAELPQRRRGGRFVFPLAATLAAAAAGVALFVLHEPQSLGVQVGKAGAPALVGAWLGAPDDGPLPLQFSDGTRFELAPSARARLLELHSAGARVELANGALHVDVVHRETTRFELRMGKFGVRVTGTRFDVSYRPDHDLLELTLEEGQVELTGCVFGSGRKIAAGQRVRASCRDGTLSVGFRDDRAFVAPPAPEPVQAPDTAVVESTERAEPIAGGPAAAPRVDGAMDLDPPRGEPAADYRALARSGRHQEAISAARASGFAAECDRASAADLALLATTARHAGASREAEQALLALRRRFPGTNEGALAAFTLGRLAFDERRAYGQAATWFKTYLNERPSGALAREALGRLLEAHYRSGDQSAARAAARSYLGRYPAGPHADLASRLVSTP